MSFPPPEESLNELVQILYTEGKTVSIASPLIITPGTHPIEIGLVVDRYSNVPQIKNRNVPDGTQISKADRPLKRLLVFNKGPGVVYFTTNFPGSRIESGIEVEPNDSGEITGHFIHTLDIWADSLGATVKIIGIV